jgi:hypothetical protein
MVGDKTSLLDKVSLNFYLIAKVEVVRDGQKPKRQRNNHLSRFFVFSAFKRNSSSAGV